MIIRTTHPAEKAETLQAIRSDSLLSKESGDGKLPVTNTLPSKLLLSRVVVAGSAPNGL
jgi:hypothetical protein